MAEYIEKWSIVDRLIDLENEFQQYKPFRGFEHAMYRKICEAEIAIGKTPTADVVEVKTLKAWLYAIAMNNVGVPIEDMASACEEIANRLDGMRAFARERKDK